MLVECVIACAVDVLLRFEVILCQSNFVLMVDFSSPEYGTFAPSGLNLLGYVGVVVVGAMLRWNTFLIN